MAKMLAEIAAQLEEPFALEDIDFLPKGQFEKDGKPMITGLPYADPRVYQDRLNAVCPGEWTSQAVVTVAGNKIIALVTVTVCGVAHTDIGEASLDGPMKENAGTESFAQGFKRACSQVGLGRYLYAMGKAYLPYDKVKKRIDLSPKELQVKVRELYAKAGLTSQRNNGNETPAPATTSVARSQSTQAAKPAQAIAKPEQSNTPAVAKPAEQNEERFEPVGSVDQALTRMYETCIKMAGTEKGPSVFQRIRAHVVGEKRDVDIVHDDLINLWEQIRKAEKRYLALAS